MSAHDSLHKVPLPFRMKLCSLDSRGYPIPYLMMPGSQITIDGTKMKLCVLGKLCMICGKKLDNKKWFIGGQLTAANRLFTDPSMHEECARYALQVCPFLSNVEMKYRKKYEPGTVPWAQPSLMRKDRSPTQVLMQTTGYKAIVWREQVYVLANRWRYVEHWCNSERVEDPPNLSARELGRTIGVFDPGGRYAKEWKDL